MEIKSFSKCKECKGEVDSENNPIYKNEIEHKNPNLATDALVIKNNKEILLIKRKHNPFQMKYALPGGFVDYNEDPKEGCLRELLEETNIKAYKTQLVEVRSNPERDPRKHIVSFIYYVEVDEDSVPEALDDAFTAQFYDISKIIKEGRESFAFDHYDIITDYLKKIKI